MSPSNHTNSGVSTVPTIPESGPDPSVVVFFGGLVSALLYAYAALAMPIGNSWALVGRFLASFGIAGAICFVVWAQLRKQPLGPRSIRLVLGYAILFRLLLLPAGIAAPDLPTLVSRDLGGEQTGFGKFLLYDNDVWRYVWDGHMAGEGYSPYAFSPNSAEQDDDLSGVLLEEELWWDVYDNLGFRALVTVYPPLAQVYFRAANLVAPGSVLVLKLGAVAADLAVCFLLLRILVRLGLPRAGLVLYAWNPLVLKEVAGSGHFEPLMLLPLLAGVDWASRRRGTRAAVAISMAALVKFSPLALAPVLARRLRWRDAVVGVAVLALGVAPYWRTIGGWLQTMQIYNREWHFNSGPWALVRQGLLLLGVEDPSSAATLICRLMAVGVMIWVWRRDDGSEPAAFRGAFFILGALVLLSPAVMPWYLLWALPFAVLAGYPSWAVLCVLSLLSYLFYVGEAEHAWWRVVEYGGFALAWVWQERWSGRVAADSGNVNRSRGSSEHGL